MRVLFAATAVLLAACAPEPPPSSNAAAFESYPEYIRNRGALPGGGSPDVQGMGGGFAGDGFSSGGIASGPVASGPIASGPDYSGAITSAQGSSMAQGTGDYAVPAGIAIQTGEMAAAAPKPGISDEQDFSAVASRESIESDRLRLEQQRAQYQQIQPTDLPQRNGDSEPNIVEYALRTANPVGVQAYRRGNPLRNSQYERSCARYPSQDLAQEDFLRRGGPDRDPRSLDPDGDGYACRWDPTPFRAAVN